MNRAEFIALASPPCHECGAPIQRTEVQHKRVEGGWAVSGMFIVCVDGHRTPIEPFEEDK